MNIKELWNKTFGKAKFEHEILKDRIAKEDEFYELLNSVLRQPGEQSVSHNMTMNGHPCVCTKTCIDGVIQTVLYDYVRPELTREEFEKQFPDDQTFVWEE